MAMATSAKLPTFFICHGGGPMPLLGDPGHSGLVRDLRALPGRIKAREQVRAILVVSAHWEAAPAVRVTSAKAPAGAGGLVCNRVPIWCTAKA